MSAKKFEKLIDLVINEDQARAEQLFHEIIVEKSRQIYESIMSEDMTGDLMDEIEDENVGMEGMLEDDESSFEQDEEMDGDFDVEGDAEEEFGDEEGEEEFGDEEFGAEEESLEDRVIRVEDELDRLMAEFEEEMGGNSDDEEEFDAGEEEEEEGMDDEEEGMDDEEESGLMENVKLSPVKGLYGSKIGGDDGEQTKSTVAANSGKRGMQGKPVNYDAGAEESQASGPKKPASYVTKGQTEVEGAKSFKNAAGAKNSISPKGEAAPKPVKTQQSGTNTRSAVPESKRTTKKRI